VKPATACYETAAFNTTTCKWDVTGTQPVKPATACYETAAFNTTTCKWDVTGIRATAPTITAGSETTFCSGGSVALGSSSSANNQWYKDGVAITASDTSQTYLATVGGVYTLTLIKSGCESDLSVATKVVVNTPPSKPTISRDASGNLLSSVATGNQWYRENTLLSGDTTDNYKPIDPANYKVVASVPGCPSEVSDLYYYVITSIPTLSNNEYLRLYPNPVASMLRIDFVLNYHRQVDLKIYDMMGKLVSEKKKLLNGSRMNLSGLVTGIYRYQVLGKDGKFLYSGKFIKN
jgi:hypothetical protein